MPAEPSIHPFRIDVPQADLDDLKARLARTRWPDQLPGAGWDYGIPLDYVQELAGYWRTGYDWRVHEQTMNAFPQFTTAIDGQNIHFLHVRSTERDALPLIITHGWPRSVVEFMEIIGPLTDPRAHGADPADAFHLVIPSIPGFGFSGPTRDAGWDVGRIARAWDELMRRLGYPRYGAQGGDWGSSISRELGLVVPGHLIGVHLNMLFPRVRDEPADLTDEERARLQAFRRFRSTGSGYYAIQSTRPQTLAYGLTDSPAGQLAWIAEKFGEWTDDGLPDEAVGRDRLLTNVTLYWLTRTAGSSARLYYEAGRSGDWGPPKPSAVPPAWRSSRGRSHRRSGVLPSSPTTSCTGPSTTAAVTSPPWRYPTSWSATCAHSSGGSAEPPVAGSGVAAPRVEVADGEAGEGARGGREVGVGAPDEAERAPGSRRLEVEPGDRRVRGQPARDRRHQPDACPRADQPADGVGLVTLAGDGGPGAIAREELVGEASLPVAGAGGDEALASEQAGLDAGLPGQAVRRGDSEEDFLAEELHRVQRGAVQALGGHAQVDLARLKLGRHDRGG